MSPHRTFIFKKLIPKTMLTGTQCLVFLILCQWAHGQTNRWQRPQQDAYSRSDNGTQSDLAKENENQVAASSLQIREVLVKDAGLLVELRRWIAKEATDNGQVVRESNLSQESIFERLDRDVAFRSVATRLLQRYGYLLPSPNPESSFAKEEDLVLKERARRLVQVEAQEDSESLHPERNAQHVDRTTTCDPQQDSECETSEAQNRTHHRRESEK